MYKSVSLFIKVSAAGRYLRASGTILPTWADNSDTQHHLPKGAVGKSVFDCANDLNIPLFVLSGVLQPKHVTVLTANFINPPIVGVAICTVLV